MRAPFNAKGRKSRADCAIDALTKHLPNYRKNSPEEISKLLQWTERAIDHAKKAVSDAIATGEPNPSTRMHLMIQRIIEESGKK